MSSTPSTSKHNAAHHHAEENSLTREDSVVSLNEEQPCRPIFARNKKLFKRLIAQTGKSHKQPESEPWGSMTFEGRDLTPSHGDINDLQKYRKVKVEEAQREDKLGYSMRDRWYMFKDTMEMMLPRRAQRHTRKNWMAEKLQELEAGPGDWRIFSLAGGRSNTKSVRRREAERGLLGDEARFPGLGRRLGRLEVDLCWSRWEESLYRNFWYPVLGRRL